MSTTILDVLTDVSLRADGALKARLVEETSAGTPWLTEES